MKNLWMLMLLIAGITSCDYDDSELKESIRTLEERIAAMEGQVNQLNTDIVSVQDIISSLEKNLSISRVETLADGYTLHFSDGTTATIRNGKDGADGEDGADGSDGVDGEDGADGKDAPIMGVGQENGIYYWTITMDGKTEWLTDESGNRLCVTGKDGAPGDDGSSGSDGVAGVTPRLSIDSEGYWLVSYDNGTTYIRVLDSEGLPVSALGTKGDPGAPGTPGTPGVAGDSFFTDVRETEDAVILTLATGEVITIPKTKAFAIHFEQTKNIPLGADGKLTLSYTITGADADTFVEVYGIGNLRAKAGDNCLYIEATGELDADSKVLVLLCNKGKTITTVLTFVKKASESQGSAEDYETEEKEWD